MTPFLPSRIMFVLWILTLSTVMARPIEKEVGGVSSFTFSAWENDLSVPFVVPLPSSSALYVQSRWGVLIEGVIVDGKVVAPDEVIINFDDPDYRKIGVQAGEVHVYLIKLTNIITGSQTVPNDHIFRRFNLPASFGRIEIAYRIRYFDGKVSSLRRVVGTNRDKSPRYEPAR